jgi:hypothetical protein
LAEACAEIGHTPTGEAAITPGFNLPAKYVIHAVGPVGEHPEELKSAYNYTLNYIDGKEIKSIGFCCISTGIYGFPIRPATHIALETVRRFLEDPTNFDHTERIIFVVFEHRDVEVYYELAPKYFPVVPLPADELKRTHSAPQPQVATYEKGEKPTKSRPPKDESAKPPPKKEESQPPKEESAEALPKEEESHTPKDESAKAPPKKEESQPPKEESAEALPKKEESRRPKEESANAVHEPGEAGEAAPAKDDPSTGDDSPSTE